MSVGFRPAGAYELTHVFEVIGAIHLETVFKDAHIDCYKQSTEQHDCSSHLL